MKLRRDVSGRRLAAALCARWGYVQVHQSGSHIILQTTTPSSHRIAIPDHNPIRIGTFHTILRSVANHKGVDRQEILDSI